MKNIGDFPKNTVAMDDFFFYFAARHSIVNRATKGQIEYKQIHKPKNNGKHGAREQTNKQKTIRHAKSRD